MCPVKAANCQPVATSHKRTVRSWSAAASTLPSGLKATPSTSSPCPARVRKSRPERTSHSRAVRSLPPLASIAPSGRKASENAEPVWARKSNRSLPVSISRSRIRPSLPAEASSLPSALKARRTHEAIVSGPARVQLAGREVVESDRGGDGVREPAASSRPSGLTATHPRGLPLSGRCGSRAPSPSPRRRRGRKALAGRRSRRTASCRRGSKHSSPSRRTWAARTGRAACPWSRHGG